jgi:hypothetical protein
MQATEKMRVEPGTFAKLLERVRKTVLALLDRYRITPAERIFMRSLPRAAPRPPGDAPIVLVETVEDHYYSALFANIVLGIAARRPIEVQQFVSRSLRPGCTRSLYRIVRSLCYYNRLTDRKWIRFYGAFCSRVAYRSASRVFSFSTLIDLINAWKIWRSLGSKESLIELTVSGTKLGDLIYDTYLRFRPSATVNLDSTYLWVVIWQALRDLRAATVYMSSVKPQMFITSYSCYVQHGIAVRVALAAGVKVVTLGNYQKFYKQLQSADSVHTQNPDDYRSGFSRLANSGAKIEEAAAALAARMAGKFDPATAYMHRSAYAEKAELPRGISGSAVLFLHDFFDSPHCYQWMIFPDFWEWATFTLNLARREGIKVFVKPHPNQIAGSRAVVRMLMRDYPEAAWLSSGTSNVQIAEAGAACAITVHGTVAHEMAYLGVPSISAGHSPHVSFTFSHTARSREEYSRLICNYRDLPHVHEALRRESLEFYCMHNLRIDADEMRLRDLILDYFALVVKHDGFLPDGGGFLSFSQRLNAEPAFRRACAEMAALLHDELAVDLSLNEGALNRERAASG